MKIALVRQKYSPYGGAERFVERALAALASQGVTTTLITRKWDTAGAMTQTPAVQAPIAQHVLTCNPFYLGRLWRDRSFSLAVQKIVAEGTFDLVQSHERIPGCDIFRAGDGLHREWLAHRSRLFTSSFGLLRRAWLKLSPYNRYVVAAEGQLFADARLKAVICISEMVKREIQSHFSLPEERLHVIYNGVDLDAFNPTHKIRREEIRRIWGVPAEAPLFLFVGSGFERKGVAAILEALPQNAWLMVIGKDRDTSRYVKIAKNKGIAGRVVFAGKQNDVRGFYGAADAFVFPTLYEPFGNVVLEAMASGLPVVTSTSCGGAELIRQGENGYVCDALDTPTLSKHMDALCDRPRASRMGAAARKSVEHLDLDTMADAMTALYTQLLSQKAAA